MQYCMITATKRQIVRLSNLGWDFEKAYAKTKVGGEGSAVLSVGGPREFYRSSRA